MDTMISEQDLADQSRALLRLKEEYMQWRIDHPFGFYARPAVVHEIPFPYSGQYPLAPFELGGATHFHNLCSWHCGIPGKSNTIMRNYYFDIVLKFPAAYPKEPPTCEFSHPAIKHIDFFQDPASLPFLNASDKWTPSLTIPRILCGIQDALYRRKFMNMLPKQVRACTRHCDTPLPFYPHSLRGGFLHPGMHSLLPEPAQVE